MSTIRSFETGEYIGTVTLGTGAINARMKMDENKIFVGNINDQIPDNIDDALKDAICIARLKATGKYGYKGNTKNVDIFTNSLVDDILKMYVGDQISWELSIKDINSKSVANIVTYCLIAICTKFMEDTGKEMSSDMITILAYTICAKALPTARVKLEFDKAYNMQINIQNGTDTFSLALE